MEQQHQRAAVRKGRTRTGCLTCRARRVKCDEDRPVCFNCTRLNRVCFYDPSPISLPSTTSDDCTELSTTSNDHNGGLNQAYTSRSLILNHVSDLQASPWDADFNAITGEWGDILPANAYPDFGLQTSPENGAGRATLDFGPTTSFAPEFSYFLNHVQPPFIVPWDLANWTNAKVEIAEMAGQSTTVRAAVLAIEQLYEAVDQGGETAATLPSYFTAKAAYTLAMRDGQPGIDVLLVATFLLCCFEVVAQQETVSTTLKQKDILVTTIEGHLNQKPWSPLAQRTIIWLYLFHAKALHLGGRGILSPKVLSLFEDQLNAVLCVPRRPGNVASGAHPVLHSLQQTLFQFYLELQRISIMAASINRHHRPRGAPVDEALVDGVSDVIERQLHNLWQGRPEILDCTAAELVGMVGCTYLDISHISLLSRLCKLCYHAEIIYYSRSQGRAETSSQRIQPAREVIRKLIDEATGGTDYDMLLLRQPALAWPLFLYSVESKREDEADWALANFNLIQNPLWHIDLVKTLTFELTQEQLRKGERADSRFFCVERYGMAPPFL